MPVGVVVKIVQFGCCALGLRCGVVSAAGWCPKHAFRHVDVVLVEHVPVCVQLHAVCWQASCFEVEDEYFTSVCVGEDTVDVADYFCVIVESGFYRVFDAGFAVDGGGDVFWMVAPPCFPAVEEDGAVVHPPVVVFLLWPARLAHVFAHSAGGFDFPTLGCGEGDLGVENVFEREELAGHLWVFGGIVQVEVILFGNVMYGASSDRGVPGVVLGVVAV